MTFHFDRVGWPSTIPEDQRVEFIKDLHKLKTELFQSAVESGIVPARPGGIGPMLITDRIDHHIDCVCIHSH